MLSHRPSCLFSRAVPQAGRIRAGTTKVVRQQMEAQVCSVYSGRQGIEGRASVLHSHRVMASGCISGEKERLMTDRVSRARTHAYTDAYIHARTYAGTKARPHIHARQNIRTHNHTVTPTLTRKHSLSLSACLSACLPALHYFLDCSQFDTGRWPSSINHSFVLSLSSI